jgi:hypothetical protein
MLQEMVRVISSPLPQVTITVVNSVEAPGGNAELNVRLNVATAIRRLRLLDRKRTLWIDAICINQSDNQEKNVQVKRISQIYLHASTVIVWLGHEEDNAIKGLDVLSHFGDEVEYSVDYLCLRSPQAAHPDWFKDNFVLPYDTDTWIAVADLLRRAWFQQLWV